MPAFKRTYRKYPRPRTLYSVDRLNELEPPRDTFSAWLYLAGLALGAVAFGAAVVLWAVLR